LAPDRELALDVRFALEDRFGRFAEDEDPLVRFAEPARFADDFAPPRDEVERFALELFAEPRDAVRFAAVLPPVLPELFPLDLPELVDLEVPEREPCFPAEDLPLVFPDDLPVDLLLLFPLVFPLDDDAVRFADDEVPDDLFPPAVFPLLEDLPDDLPELLPEELRDDELFAELEPFCERELLDLPPPAVFPPPRFPLDEPLLPPVEPLAPPPGSDSAAAGMTVSAAAATPPMAAPAAAPVSISLAASITLSRMPEPPDLFEPDLLDDDDPPPELEELELSAIEVLPLIVFFESRFNSKLTYIKERGNTFFRLCRYNFCSYEYGRSDSRCGADRARTCRAVDTVRGGFPHRRQKGNYHAVFEGDRGAGPHARDLRTDRHRGRFGQPRVDRQQGKTVGGRRGARADRP
jgi:hypothetical protein